MNHFISRHPAAPKRSYFVAGPLLAGERYYAVTAASGQYLGRINAVSAEQACERACSQAGYTYYTPTNCTAQPIA